MTGPDPSGSQPPLHFPTDGYPPAPPLTPPGFGVQSQPTMPAPYPPPTLPPTLSQPIPAVIPQTGPLPVGPPTGAFPAPERKAPGRGLVITLIALVLVFLAGSVALGTMYFTAEGHLNTTNQQLSTTKNSLANTQGQLKQANSDNQSLTTQKNDLSTQVASMQPCAKSAKALADLLSNDLKNNANPFLDPGIVNPMSDEIRDCQ